MNLDDIKPTSPDEPMRHYVLDQEYDGGVAVKICNLAVPTPEAELAQELIARWGMVAATEDGEDSGGRQKLRLLKSDELIERACTTAENFHAEMKRRGWLLRLPRPVMGSKERFDAMGDLKRRTERLAAKMEAAASGAPPAQSEQVQE